MKSLIEIFEDENIEHTQLSKKEGYEVHHDWLELFASRLKDQTGKFKIGNYVWEAYWSGLLSSIDGDEATRLYRSKPIEDYYVIYENGREVFDCRSNSWPSFFWKEVIVFPKSRSWALVYSHEETVHFVEPET